MRLVLVELRRLRLRRAVALLLVACAAVTVVVFAGTAWNTRPVSADELQRAQVQVEREQGSTYVRREIARCERRPGRYGAADAAACAEVVGPQVEWFLDRNPLRVGELPRGAGLGVITVLMGLLMLVGTTFAGADWSSGSMSNQLLFEPRRWRVWLAKGAAVLALALATSATLLAGFWGAVALLARGRELETPPEVWDLVLASSGRAVLVIGAAAVGAYAVTMLFRSTVFTLGALFAVVVGATVVMSLLTISEAWFPNKSLGAVIWDGTRYYVEPPPACLRGDARPPDGVDCSGVGRLSLWEGARNLGVLLAAAVAASLGSFLRRDVP